MTNEFWRVHLPTTHVIVGDSLLYPPPPSAPFISLEALINVKKSQEEMPS